MSVDGTVIPYTEVTMAAQLPGRIKYLAGIEVDAFDSGDLLVSIDDSELVAKRQALIAQIATADAQCGKHARLTLDPCPRRYR
jgi:multidrug efflux pump subunit AcrA (membrane-fusion protein)